MLSIKQGTVIVIVTSLLTSCGGQPPADTPAQPQEVVAATKPAYELNQLNWLAGRWEQKTPEGTIFEEWTTMENGYLAGKGGFIKGKDTMISETISLEKSQNDILYIPTVKGQNNDQPVPFTLTVAAGDSFVFENPAHDFPSKITYHKVSETAMTAKISGKINGKEEFEAFEMHRAGQ